MAALLPVAVGVGAVAGVIACRGNCCTARDGGRAVGPPPPAPPTREVLSGVKADSPPRVRAAAKAQSPPKGGEIHPSPAVVEGRRTSPKAASPRDAAEPPVEEKVEERMDEEELVRRLTEADNVLRKGDPISREDLKEICSLVIRAGKELEDMERPDLCDQAIDLLDTLHPAITRARGRVIVPTSLTDEYMPGPDVSEDLRALCHDLRETPPSCPKDIEVGLQRLVPLAGGDISSADHGAVQWASMQLLRKKKELVQEAMETAEQNGEI
eukprot:Hpha_TRINITY_DN15950_c1_g12::TRINITY_DN15950_c1_g12_i1::g.70718::m.70718